jgi:hypothetical protein
VNGYVVPPRRPRNLAEAWKHVLQNPERFAPESIRGIVEKTFSFDQCLGSYEDLLSGDTV